MSSACFTVQNPESTLQLGDSQLVKLFVLFAVLLCVQTHGREILQLFQDVFSLLPVATVIDGKILIVHGGISDQTDLDFLSSIERHKVSGNNQPTFAVCQSSN